MTPLVNPAASELANRLGARLGRRQPLRISLIYAAVAAAWIFFSDRLVAAFSTEVATNTELQTAKGLLYVALTALLLFALIRRYVAELAQAREELRAVVEGMAEAVVVSSADAQIVDANRAALKLFGVANRSDLLGPLDDLRSRLRLPNDEPLTAQADPLLLALKGGGPVSGELRISRAQGEPAWVSYTAAPVVENGHIRMAVALLHDIGEVKRLEALRDEFLSTAAHELKTPVAAIKGYVQLLQRWTPEGHEPREKTAFQVLNRQCDRLARLVQELLDVSRLQLGKLELHRNRVDLGALTTEVVERMQPLTRGRRLELVASPAPVLADRDRVDEVLMNLLDNAIRFSRDGGTILAKVEASGREAVVSVQDQGLGIPEERQSQVFEPFFRAHAGTDLSDHGGMGIGLHVSRAIIERHGGRIWFESRPGTGSTFHFSLPLAESDPR